MKLHKSGVIKLHDQHENLSGGSLILKCPTIKSLRILVLNHEDRYQGKYMSILFVLYWLRDHAILCERTLYLQ